MAGKRGYISGFCGTGTNEPHKHCRGEYAGTACECECHKDACECHKKEEGSKDGSG